MRNAQRLFLTLAAISLAIAAPCLADSMRCGNHLVGDGDTAGKLSSRCGKPAGISHSTVLRTPVLWIRGKLVRTGYGTVEVPVETWEYNFGPNRLIQRVRIEDGLVVAIDTLGYGYP
ncbi:MAG: DUF2845 domain-containing protein [Pseudomonadota bacterium]